ncbi:DivIVA domain-containing protein [Actinomyces trachealis]|uniref:DivIVA domain-containing protein n=1 Tax=Actinomyces trachealis TaxID=2763540 RepID=UPI001892B2B8|nr:DivIVA domain-containing protein [Actinomyces trachealis]
MLLTSTQVTESRFPATELVDGYDIYSVDTYLDQITNTLRAWEVGASSDNGQVILRAQDVNDVIFPVTTAEDEEGYSVDQIDDFLDEVVRTLQHYEARATASAAVSTEGRPLTAEDVSHLTFTTVKLQEGYDREQVDTVRDKIALALRAREAGTWVGGPFGMLTSTDVRKLGFQRTMFHTGYDPNEVNAFLDDVARTLAEYETRSCA